MNHEVSFYTLLPVLVTMERSSIDVKPPASRADRLFLIAIEGQWRERASHGEDSRGARTLTDDSKEDIYERHSSQIVGTTNLAITLPFTLDDDIQ